MTTVLNVKQAIVKAGRMDRKAAEMRKLLWPNVEDAELWDRKKAAGFTTMPRTMPHIINIIDSLSKGRPGGSTYLTIWCRLFYPGIVELAGEIQMAREAGFGGERAVDTWRKRMRTLKDLGFIDYQPAGSHDFEWVLVYNPHHVIQRLGNKVQTQRFAAWKSRAMEIGAKDIDAFPSVNVVSAKKEKADGKVAIHSKPLTKKALKNSSAKSAG